MDTTTSQEYENENTMSGVDMIYSYIIDCGTAFDKKAANEVLASTHPWFQGDVDAILDYIIASVPENRLLEYAQCIDLVYVLDIASDYTHTFPNATLPGMVGAFYAMYSNYTNLSTYAINSIIYSIQQSCEADDCYFARMAFLTTTHVNELHDMICGELDGFYTLPETYILDYCNKVLLHEHNAMISPFSEVWDEHYHSEGDDCMTTWLPKEVVEDIVHLTDERCVDTLLTTV